MPPRGFGRSLIAAVGNTPAVSISAPLTPEGRNSWAKLEAFPPGGLKDRSALPRFAITRARGDLRPGVAIVESSSSWYPDHYSSPDDAGNAPAREHLGRQATAMPMPGRRTPAARVGSDLCVLGERS
ncbi:hypothetical protein [Streptomyces sp. NBC_00589]|nr:hypothetical protein [Streptomyces sp. NBC_00589]